MARDIVEVETVEVVVGKALDVLAHQAFVDLGAE